MKPDNKSNPEKELTGKVVVKKFGTGSKSEHDAVCLETTEGTYVLKRLGGNPFNDPELNKLVGKQIKATGLLDQYQFLAKTLKETGE
jgi:hypothetical protein